MKEHISIGGRLFKENRVNEMPLEKENIIKKNAHELGELKNKNGDKVIIRVNNFKVEKKRSATQSAVEYAKIGNELFKELADKYHVRQPEIMFFVGKDAEDEISVYTASNIIEGNRLESQIIALGKDSFDLEDENNLLLELDNLYVSMLDYYFDIIKAFSSGGKRYLWDIGHVRQYMYGKKKGDDINHIYLIDFDPYFYEATPENSLKAVEKFIYWIRSVLVEEEHTGYQFVGARKSAIQNIHALLELNDSGNSSPLDAVDEQTLQSLLIKLTQ